MKNYLELIEIKPRLSFTLLFVITINLILFVAASIIFGVLMTILTISLFFQTSGFIIDRENNRVKKVRGFWGMKIGKWQKLPEFKYVSLLRVKQGRKSYQASSAMFVQKSSNSNIYKVNLVIDSGTQKVFNLINANKEKAIETGLLVGEYLDLKVLDVTTHEKKWIR
jgi:hypothetical protein